MHWIVTALLSILFAVAPSAGQTAPSTAPVASAPSATTAPLPDTGGSAPTSKKWFDPSRSWMLVMLIALCGAVLVCIQIARTGRPMWVRKIAALQAVDEAVGRATEMGRPCLFIPGIQDMDDMGTIAGISVLNRVARTVADYGAEMEVPVDRSLVMTACREAVQSAYYAAGRPDAYSPDRINYITDDQFGYVAYVLGRMMRHKPAACFYMGTFFAESLLLAETGHAIGAIQIAGTREPSQLPFFVAACDYTLIGEEFFAASAYLSNKPDEIGSLKGQDLGKVILGGFIIFGCLTATLASVLGSHGDFFQRVTDYIINKVLSA